MHLPFRKSNDVIHNGSAVGIVGLRPGEEAVIDPLGDDDVREFDVAEAGVLEGVLDCLQLGLHNIRNLSVADAIPKYTMRRTWNKFKYVDRDLRLNSPEHEDSLRQTSVDVKVLPERLSDAWLHCVT